MMKKFSITTLMTALLMTSFLSPVSAEEIDDGWIVLAEYYEYIDEIEEELPSEVVPFNYPAKIYNIKKTTSNGTLLLNRVETNAVGSTLTNSVNTTLSSSISLDFGVSKAPFSAALGYNVTSSVTLNRSNSIVVPSSVSGWPVKLARIDAYPIYEHTSFTYTTISTQLVPRFGTAQRAVGVKFVVSYK